MTPQPEILERLQQIPNLREKPTRLYSWPERWDPKYVDHWAEVARFTGSAPLSWRWASQDTVDAVVALCKDTNAKICLHVSPDCPASAEQVKDAVGWYRGRWKVFDGMLGGRIKIEVVYVDLEGFKYKLDDYGHNEAVGELNRAVYRIAKHHCKGIEVRRYNHLAIDAVNNTEKGGWGVNADTGPYDPVDGGFGISLYNPIDPVGQRDLLTRTIEHAKLYGINRGTAWVALGGAQVGDWVCPGLGDAKKRWQPFPYDPEISYQLGGLFGNSWQQQTVHGESSRNGRFPNTTKCDVVFWPGWFGEEEERTHSIHAVGFLNGFVPRSYAQSQEIIADLRKLQVQYWTQTQKENE